MVVQDDLYSRFAEHIKTFCLENPRLFQFVCVKYAYDNGQDTLFPNEGSVL